jgi:hypothetical protein
MTRGPIASTRTPAEPSPAVLHAALRLLATGPVYRAGKRNGLAPCIAAELLRQRRIETTTITRSAFGVNLAIGAYAITAAGRAALAAANADTGSPQTQRAA